DRPEREGSAGAVDAAVAVAVDRYGVELTGGHGRSGERHVEPGVGRDLVQRDGGFGAADFVEVDLRAAGRHRIFDRSVVARHSLLDHDLYLTGCAAVRAGQDGRGFVQHAADAPDLEGEGSVLGAAHVLLSGCGARIARARLLRESYKVLLDSAEFDVFGAFDAGEGTVDVETGLIGGVARGRAADGRADQGVAVCVRVRAGAGAGFDAGVAERCAIDRAHHFHVHIDAVVALRCAAVPRKVAHRGGEHGAGSVDRRDLDGAFDEVFPFAGRGIVRVAMDLGIEWIVGAQLRRDRQLHLRAR